MHGAGMARRSLLLSPVPKWKMYILVFAGGVIPMQDYDYLYQAGVVAIFGPGTSVAKAACQIMEIMLED